MDGCTQQGDSPVTANAAKGVTECIEPVAAAMGDKTAVSSGKDSESIDVTKQLPAIVTAEILKQLSNEEIQILMRQVGDARVTDADIAKMMTEHEAEMDQAKRLQIASDEKNWPRKPYDINRNRRCQRWHGV